MMPLPRRLRAACVLLLCAAASGCAERMLGPESRTDRGAIFDELWQQFDRHYPSFELKGVDWAGAAARHRGRALAAPTEGAFALELAAMLNEIHDVHVTLTPTGGLGTLRYVSCPDTTTTFFLPAFVFERYVQQPAWTPGHQLRYGMVADSVGYIQIPSLAGDDWAGAEIDAALAALPGARRAMILDVRENRGGSVENAREIAGRFADRARVYGYLRQRDGPAHSDLTDFIEEWVEPRGRSYPGAVIVLANHHSFSAAEDFVLAMRVLPGVTVVGDTTAGASGGPVRRELANGWTYELPEWIEYTPERRTFEGIGLAPQVVVRPAARDFAAGLDPALERAIQLARPAAAARARS